MKKRWMLAGLLVWLLLGAAGCEMADTSPKLIYKENGAQVDSGFTLNSLKETIRGKAGKMQVKEDEFIKSGLVEVYMHPSGESLIVDKVCQDWDGFTVKCGPGYPGELKIWFGLMKAWQVE